MSKIVQVFFDGEKKDCLVQTDSNGEITCFARDGQFVKFPAGSDVDKEVSRHNADPSNSEKPVFAAEAEEKKNELDSWLTELPDDHPRKSAKPETAETKPPK